MQVCSTKAGSTKTGSDKGGGPPRPILSVTQVFSDNPNNVMRATAGGRLELGSSVVSMLVLGLLFASGGCGGGNAGVSSMPQPPSPAGPPPPLQLVAFVSGLSSPLDLESARDGSGRLFVVEQAGRIRIIRNGSVAAAPFLDITAKVTSGGELGLLGLAFHPNYASNRRFFVNYTRASGTRWETVIAEYQASAGDPDQADAASERILLTVPQPFSNHNGGAIGIWSGWISLHRAGRWRQRRRSAG